MSSAAEGYRPPNWGTQPQVYSMTCTLPASTPAGSNNNTNANATPASSQPTTYFFDGVSRTEHVQEAVGTKHPVQAGPAVVDHIYLLPARVVLDVVISDVMQSFQAGQYSSNSSRSVSAYLTFKQIQAARVPITLSTRLDTYSNMWLSAVRGTEDFRTTRGFRGTLIFEQIISAQVNSSTSTSTRPDATGATNEGTKGVETPGPNVLAGTAVP